MRHFIFLITLFGFFVSCSSPSEPPVNNDVIVRVKHPIVGEWLRMGHEGPIRFHFKDNGEVEGDFGNDQSIDVISRYEISHDTIKFQDIKGHTCSGFGIYKMYQSDYYLSFDLVQDDCGGRIKTTMGFWAKPNFKMLIEQLNKEILENEQPEMYLNRGRIRLATGEVKEAKLDFDSYIETDSTVARVFINRAGTRFPFDMNGVVYDCNKAIQLEPNNKNAYFLRGLARYELGYPESACSDFDKAIELGFSVLRVAEQNKCEEFWD